MRDQQQNKVNIIAYDTGALAAAYGMAVRPDFFSKNVNLVSMLAPAIQFKHSSIKDMRFFQQLRSVGHDFLKATRMYELFGDKKNGEKEILTKLEATC